MADPRVVIFFLMTTMLVSLKVEYSKSKIITR